MEPPVPPAHAFQMRFTAAAAHIDVLGHVNNAVWVQWMEQAATAHWQSAASADDQARWIWFVVRHEIDYARQLALGESVTCHTWVPERASGARFLRFMHFIGDTGQVHVRTKTDWALIDKASGRLSRVPQALVDNFAPRA